MNRQKFLTIAAIIFAVLMVIAIVILWSKFLASNKRAKISLMEIQSKQNLIDYDKYENYPLHHLDGLIRYSEFFAESFEESINQVANLDKEKLASLEKYCNFQIEEGIREFIVAKSYDCLAKINDIKNEPASVYKAIRDASSAIETLYVKSYAQNLARLIINGFEEEVKVTFTNSGYQGEIYDFINGKKDDELVLLAKLAESKYKQLRLNALYRMSIIHNFGRASNSEAKQLDLKLAAKFQKEVFEESGITPTKNTEIAFVFNDPHAKYGLTTIASILLNSDFDNHYNFHVVMYDGDEVSELNKQKLQQLQYIRPYNIEFHVFPKSVVEKNKDLFNLAAAQLPPLVLIKALMHHGLPTIDSSTVLDVDIIVLRDLYRLYKQEENFDNIFIAGALDPDLIQATKLREGCLGVSPLSYINSGVMTMNLKNMREYDATNIISERFWKSKCPKPGWFDQDIINVSLGDRIKYISTRWNMRAGIQGYYNKEFMPFIVHYMGRKPWVEKIKQKIDAGESLPFDIKLWWAYSDLVNSIVK